MQSTEIYDDAIWINGQNLPPVPGYKKRKGYNIYQTDGSIFVNGWEWTGVEAVGQGELVYSIDDNRLYMHVDGQRIDVGIKQEYENITYSTGQQVGIRHITFDPVTLTGSGDLNRELFTSLCGVEIPDQNYREVSEEEFLKTLNP